MNTMNNILSNLQLSLTCENYKSIKWKYIYIYIKFSTTDTTIYVTSNRLTEHKLATYCFVIK